VLGDDIGRVRRENALADGRAADRKERLVAAGPGAAGFEAVEIPPVDGGELGESMGWRFWYAR